MTGGQPSPEWLNAQLPVERRRLMQVQHSIAMLAELPGHVFASTTGGLWVACLESWLIHGRLLAEFLLFKPANPNLDFSAADFGFSLPTPIETSEVVELWHEASRLLVHFSKSRTPDDASSLESSRFVSASGMLSVSRILIDTAGLFVQYLPAETPGRTDLAADVSRAAELLDRFQARRVVPESGGSP